MKRLETVLPQCVDVLQARTVSGGAPDILPMDFGLVPGNKAVKTPLRRNTAKLGRFLNRSLNKLVKFGFLEPDPGSTW